MVSGGQGVYLWFLARELARLGHRVDVIVGPPYPDPMPFAASVTRVHDERFWGKWFSRDRSALLPRPQPLRIFQPLDFWEFGATWFGFLPEPFAFSVRALRRVAARLAAGDRWDIVHDVQTLGWGLLGIRALGLPVVTTIHHPLSVDRRTSFVRDQSPARGARDHDLLPGRNAGLRRAPPGSRVHLLGGERAPDRNGLRNRSRRGSAWWPTASTQSCSARIPASRGTRPRSCAWRAPRTRTRACAR